jgi:hypothetical protein
MRLSEERYSRDLRRLGLAAQLLRFQVRTGLVQRWTALPRRRIESLRRRVLDRPDARCVRHRGPPPRQTAVFFRNALRASEAAAIGVLCELFDVMPAARGPQEVARLPSLARGERLCQAYAAYQALVPEPQYSLDQVMLLLEALVRGELVELVPCRTCQVTILIDRLSADPRLCPSCRGLHRRRGHLSQVSDEPAACDDPPGQGSVGDRQGQLF